MNSTIRNWLESLGLAQYASAFEDNDIDLELLAQVDDQALKDIGVASAGHRLRLRTAIQKLSSESAAPSGPAQSSPSLTAERRQLTIAFCDLVGSTQLAQSMDPERLRELMQAYQQTCRSVIEKYEGHVAQYLGDGLMVYFGWPRAHEDDAERAVRAAMEIVETIARLGTERQIAQGLRVRLGIATGPVVVGETGAGDASVPKLAVGETPNLASRLQGLAAPNQIIIGPATQRLLGNTFTLEDLGAHTLKGITEPVRAYAITGLGAQEGRFEAARGQSRLTPMVGREDELAVLMRRWEQARSGEGHAVLLCGEAGIGKSRILRAVLERIAQGPHLVLRHQCSPFHTHSTLYPFTAQVQSAFARDDSVDARLGRLEAWLREGGVADDAAPALVAGLLSLPTTRYPTLQLSPQRQKERTLSLFAQRVAGLSTQQPVLLLFEDAHWADPTTLELLDLILRRLESLRVMVLITYRPEFTPSWVGQSLATLLTLSRLSRREAEALVLRVTQGKPLPTEVMGQILAKTDGVPLFVEELTKTVIESSLLKETAEAYLLEGPLPPLAIPSTLQDSLMARLDRLAGGKEVAQIGACIGREFGYELLRSVWQLSRQGLDGALKLLTDAEILFRRGDGEQAVYTFKHALIQDAAYESLLKSRRVQIHQRIAEVMEEKFPEIAKAQPEVLAQHYSAGEQWTHAVEHWQRAGDLAIERVAPREAIVHLDCGMETLRHIPPSQHRDRQELALRGALAVAWIDYGGWAHPKIGEALQGARELAQSTGQVDRNTFRVFSGLALYEMCSGKVKDSLRNVHALQQLAELAADDSMILAASFHQGCSGFYLGEYSMVLAHAEGVDRRYSLEIGKRASDLISHDPKLQSDVWKFLSLWALGFPDTAVTASNACIAHARALSNPNNLIHVLMHSAYLHAHRGEIRGLEAYLTESEALARQHELAFVYDTWIPFSGIWGALLRGDYANGLKEQMDAALKYKASGNLIGMPWVTSACSIAAVRAGNPTLAITLTDEVLEQIHRPGWEERGQLADVLRARGLAMAALKRDEEAEATFHQALDVAREQKAKSLELRVATSLAEFWKARGNKRAAHDLLQPIYAWFTEGFDTRDLVEAKALLDSLR